MSAPIPLGVVAGSIAGPALLDERPHALDALDEAFVAQEGDGAVVGVAADAVLLLDAAFRRDRSARGDPALGDLGAQQVADQAAVLGGADPFQAGQIVERRLRD